MKLISLSLSSLLLLSGCGAPKNLTNDGEIVSCASIKVKVEITSGTSLKCLNESASVMLESIKGPVLVNVWGSWCPPCRQEIPLLKKAYDAGRVAIVGIDIDEPNIEVGQKYAKSAGISWPNLTDPKGVTKGSFGMGVPVTWFINANGVVTYKHIGAFKNEEQLNQEIDKYL